MFNIQKKLFLFLVSALFLFPSCIRYYKVSNIEFHQGYDHGDEREALDGNKKTVAIYDEFMTKAIFDVLYLSDSVRLAYVNKYCEKKGSDNFAKERMIDREVELGKHWITFYVLADVRDKKHVSLTDKNSSWSLFLRLENKMTIPPLSIKEVDLQPEYQYLFGSMFNSFKRSYEVKFPAKDLNNENYFNNDELFQLVVSSSYKESFFSFNEQKNVTVSKKKPAPKKVAVCKYCDSVVNREPSKRSRLKNISYEKKKSSKKQKVKEKQRKILKDEDFYWI